MRPHGYSLTSSKAHYVVCRAIHAGLKQDSNCAMEEAVSVVPVGVDRPLSCSGFTREGRELR